MKAPAIHESPTELINVLRGSLYPGAQEESIKMVIGYCKATGLDPLQKPVHIVPMWDSKERKMRDVIMPGIGSYRTQAARSGNYAGASEPEYGEDVTETLDGTKITYPQWCRVVVKRLLSNDLVAEFAAIERWKENYATAGRDTVAPNAMWKRRPYAQLAKCAEAQALRKAFPEVGAQPTADEMEGKSLEDASILIDSATGEIVKDVPAELPEYTEAQIERNLTKWQEAITAGRITPDEIIAKIKSGYRLTDAQVERIRAIKQPPPVDSFVADMEAAERLELQA